MKSISKNILLTLTALCGSGLAQANDTVVVKGTIRVPTCTVTAPSTVPLGFFVRNVTMFFPSFEINVDCPKSVLMELYAQHKVLGGYDHEHIDMLDGEGRGGGTIFWLESSPGVKIHMEAAAAPDRGFCQGTGTLVCLLTPVVRAQGDNKPGERTATVSFNLRYKS